MFKIDIIEGEIPFWELKNGNFNDIIQYVVRLDQQIKNIQKKYNNKYGYLFFYEKLRVYITPKPEVEEKELLKTLREKVYGMISPLLKTTKLSSLPKEIDIKFLENIEQKNDLLSFYHLLILNKLKRNIFDCFKLTFNQIWKDFDEPGSTMEIDYDKDKIDLFDF